MSKRNSKFTPPASAAPSERVYVSDLHAESRGIGAGRDEFAGDDLTDEEFSEDRKSVV
jgi:hypothetical protein